MEHTLLKHLEGIEDDLAELSKPDVVDLVSDEELDLTIDVPDLPMEVPENAGVEMKHNDDFPSWATTAQYHDLTMDDIGGFPTIKMNKRDFLGGTAVEQYVVQFHDATRHFNRWKEDNLLGKHRQNIALPLQKHIDNQIQLISEEKDSLTITISQIGNLQKRSQKTNVKLQHTMNRLNGEARKLLQLVNEFAHEVHDDYNAKIAKHHSKRGETPQTRSEFLKSKPYEYKKLYDIKEPGSLEWFFSTHIVPQFIANGWKAENKSVLKKYAQRGFSQKKVFDLFNKVYREKLIEARPKPKPKKKNVIDNRGLGIAVQKLWAINDIKTVESAVLANLHSAKSIYTKEGYSQFESKYRKKASERMDRIRSDQRKHERKIADVYAQVHREIREITKEGVEFSRKRNKILGELLTREKNALMGHTRDSGEAMALKQIANELKRVNQFIVDVETIKAAAEDPENLFEYLISKGPHSDAPAIYKRLSRVNKITDPDLKSWSDDFKKAFPIYKTAFLFFTKAKEAIDKNQDIDKCLKAKQLGTIVEKQLTLNKFNYPSNYLGPWFHKLDERIANLRETRSTGAMFVALPKVEVPKAEVPKAEPPESPARALDELAYDIKKEPKTPERVPSPAAVASLPKAFRKKRAKKMRSLMSEYKEPEEERFSTMKGILGAAKGWIAKAGVGIGIISPKVSTPPKKKRAIPASTPSPRSATISRRFAKGSPAKRSPRSATIRRFAKGSPAKRSPSKGSPRQRLGAHFLKGVSFAAKIHAIDTPNIINKDAQAKMKEKYKKKTPIIGTPSGTPVGTPKKTGPSWKHSSAGPSLPALSHAMASVPTNPMLSVPTMSAMSAIPSMPGTTHPMAHHGLSTPPHSASTISHTSPSGFTHAAPTSVMPAVNLPAPPPILNRYLRSLMPNMFPIPELKPMVEHQFSRQFKKDHRDQIKEFQPQLKAGKHGVRERIGTHIEVIVFPHRFEFIVYPGVDKESIREMISKIHHHMNTISDKVKVDLFLRGKGSKHTLLLHGKEMHVTFQKLRQRFKKFLTPKISNVKHIVLHMQNAVGGSLFSTLIHQPNLRQYFMQ